MGVAGQVEWPAAGGTLPGKGRRGHRRRHRGSATVRDRPGRWGSATVRDRPGRRERY